MRITNKMMTNNMLSNINKNKISMSKLEEQYSTGKKIQKPSDDPIITVRALKLRTNLSELTQYYDKNIPDAMSWMDVTESALTTVNRILKDINTYCVQGSSDTLKATNRKSIVQNLQQMKAQIYQEINSNYAGRYVFTGYKTDTPMVFDEKPKNISYEIQEQFKGEQIEYKNKVVGAYNLTNIDDPSIPNDDPPQMTDVYRIQLSYDNIDHDIADISISYKEGNDVFTITPLTTYYSYEEDAYQPTNGAHIISDTGEIILSKDAYDKLKNSTNIDIKYKKSSFEKGDIRPEHYFDCTKEDLDAGKTITFTKTDTATGKKISQDIEYEINYNQKLIINTEASDAISLKVGRDIDEILNCVNDVIKTEEKIAEVEKRLEDSSLTEDERERYEKILEHLNTELELKEEIMQKAFSNGITSSHNAQDKLNAAISDLGSRYVRLQLTESRLSSQKVDFEELLSTNEDADIVDTIVKFTSVHTLYNASLQAAAKLVQNSLLNFL